MKVDDINTDKIANSTDYPPIAICFYDTGINKVFSDFLTASGIDNIIVYNLSELSSYTKVITEPVYYPYIKEILPKNRLLVGKGSKLNGLDGHFLEQPLTEEKINSVIASFLDN